RPLLVSVLNTPPEEGSADLAGAVMRETFAKGGQAIRPRIATPSLAEAFVEPALHYLSGHAAEIQLGRRLTALKLANDKVVGLTFADGEVAVAEGESVILAVPPWTIQDLLPGVPVPDAFCAIVNAHFKAVPPAGTPAMLGLIGGTAEWVFA